MSVQGYFADSDQKFLNQRIVLLHQNNDVNVLIKKSELISKCQHENKLMISSVKDNRS